MSKDAFDAHGARIFWGTTLSLFAAHLGLWWWAKTAPFPAAVVALVLFLSVQGVNIALDPSTMWKGILVKVLFLVALISAVKAGHQASQLRGERA